MTATIQVERLDVLKFMVTLTDESGATTQHVVTATYEDEHSYGDHVSLEDLVAETFRFLLEQGPHSMIQGHFGLEDIARMYPMYEFEMTRRLSVT
jgi:hypothetical protein